jgi:hypothetical protein
MPPLQPVIKSYPPRGPLQQYRLTAPAAFVCFRCHHPKKSRLWSLYKSDWSHALCNGCYGRLLSIYEVEAGTSPDDERAAALASVVATLVSADDAHRALSLNALAVERSRHLSPQAQRFLGTAEYIARALAGRTDLDWSAAVIGLCKAVETEFVARLIDQLRVHVGGVDLTADETDAQLGRVARYCSGQRPDAPELGAVRMFLETAAHSKDRAGRSALIEVLRNRLAQWPYSGWLLDRDGALRSLAELTASYRNRAAHLDELTESDYDGCFDLVVGEGGILWNLINATRPRVQR